MIDFSKPTPFVTYWDDYQGEHIRIDDTYESTPEYIQKLWYEGLCSAEELQRILSVQNAQDYILRAAVDTISQNPILCRVIIDHKRALGDKWSLEKFFSPLTDGYLNFKSHLPRELQSGLNNIGTGCLLSKHMNGIIFNSTFGLCSVISYSIKYVVEYATLALFKIDENISDQVRCAAMILAIRIFKGLEHLDLDIDKRVRLPKKIRQSMHKPLPYICTFIAGHEYSHYLNGDIKSKKSKKFMANDIQTSWIGSIYSYNKAKEFNADITALKVPNFSNDEYANYYFYTLFWFVILAILEVTDDNSKSTHPSAIARYNNILQEAPKPMDFDEMEDTYTKIFPQLMEFLRKEITKDMINHPYIYNSFGSFYLE